MPSLRALTPRKMPAIKAAEIRAGEWLPMDHERPATRADCSNVPRPCPYVGCRYHLFLEVTPKGGLKRPYGDDLAALKTMPDTCALDVAERGGMELKELARMLELSLWGTLLIINSAYARLAQSAVVKENSDGRELPSTRVIQIGQSGRHARHPSGRYSKIGCKVQNSPVAGG